MTSGLTEKRGPRTEIAAVERREARRSASWTGNLRQPEIGPTARRATRCGDPHQRRLGAPPPSRLVRGKVRKARARMRRENTVGCLKFESSREPQRNPLPPAGEGAERRSREAGEGSVSFFSRIAKSPHPART